MTAFTLSEVLHVVKSHLQVGVMSKRTVTVKMMRPRTDTARAATNHHFLTDFTITTTAAVS